LLAIITLIAALTITHGRSVPAIGLAIGVWLIAGGLAYLWTRIQRGEGAALRKLALLPLAVWSMSIAHIGAGVLTIGAIAETGFRAEQAVELTPGQGVTFAGRRISLLEVGAVEGPNYSATRANFRVDNPNGTAQPISAERRYFPTSPAPTTEFGILSGLDGDLYIALGEQVRGTSAWAVRLYHNPLVYFIFTGALMMAIGGALSLIVLARRGRRSEAAWG
jgi:cytochrome c-type biogenesis protein CcmF